MATIHVPVLLKETMQYLVSRPDGIYVDATLGTGGHFQELSSQLNQDAVLVGIDADGTAIQHCKENLQIRQKHLLIQANFDTLKAVCFRNGFLQISGILMDLGLSSFALDNPERGFSYSNDGPLDMRFSEKLPRTAGDIINNAKRSELIEIFKTYAEERRAKSIATAIIQERELGVIQGTAQLADIIRRKTHPLHTNATLSRIFQALRIVVNNELSVLKTALKDAIEILEPDGRLVVISYHSLEDRIVKQFFNTEASDCICPPEFPICQCDHHARIQIVTSKPVLPSPAEIETNPRARSAKLRAAVRLDYQYGKKENQ